MSHPAIRALLIDLSGTLHIASAPTTAAAAALSRVAGGARRALLQQHQPGDRARALREQLSSLGFDVRDGELWTSLGALMEVVRKIKLQRPYALLSDSAMEKFPEFRSAAADAMQHHKSYNSVLVVFAPEHLAYGSRARTTYFRCPRPSMLARKPHCSLQKVYKIELVPK
ncbi:hypothetical protein DFH11DRAFT_1555240 [Phellopilus nigrolimitatus]|nr:hypothetical protein DFH11DRAFT_1555240 [Phellopilus nigrolimitatus]